MDLEKQNFEHAGTCKQKKSITKPKQNVVPLTRPKRIAAIRQSERMVVWTSRLNAEHIDWFDSDEDDDNEVAFQGMRNEWMD